MGASGHSAAASDRLVWSGTLAVGLFVLVCAAGLGLMRSTPAVLGYAPWVAWVSAGAKAVLAMLFWRLAAGRALRPLGGALGAMLAVVVVDFAAVWLVLSVHPDTAAPPFGELATIAFHAMGYFVYPHGDVTLPLAAIAGFAVARWCEQLRIAAAATA